jgi:hypothetical protein
MKRKVAFGILGGMLLLISCVSMVLGGERLSNREAFIGDIIKGYTYQGEAVVNNSCDVLNLIQEKLGDSAIIDGVQVVSICNKDAVKLDTFSRNDVDLEMSWVKKTPVYAWSLGMSILLWVGFLGGFAGGIAYLCKIG